MKKGQGQALITITKLISAINFLTSDYNLSVSAATAPMFLNITKCLLTDCSRNSTAMTLLLTDQDTGT